MIEIHRTHVMIRMRKGGATCEVCSRCICHRAGDLKFQCPGYFGEDKEK